MSEDRRHRRRRHRHGLHRHGPRRGAAPDRRPGPRRPRQHPGARPARADGPRRRARLPVARRDPRRPGRRRRPRHLAEPPPRPAGVGDPRRRQARRLREAAGDDRRRSRPSWSRWPPAAGSSTRSTSTSASTRSTSTSARSSRPATLGDVRFVTGHYFQDWLLHDTDWNWRLEPDKGGALRAVGDIGSHWLDLMAFVTGQPIVVGDGRPRDVRRQRASEPTGPVETFSTERSARHGRPPMAPRTRRRSCSGSTNGARGSVGVSQISAGRKNSLQWEIDGSDGARRVGLGDSPTSSGSAIATARTRSSSGTRR